MDEVAQEDRERYRVAQPSRVQSLPMESMDAYGTFTVPSRQLRRGGKYLCIYVTNVCHPACHIRKSTSLAGKMLRWTGLDIRRRGHHTQDAQRLYTLEGKEGMGLYTRWLLSSYKKIRRGYTIPQKGYKARDASQAESPRVVSHGTDTGGAGSQAGSLQGI